MNNNPIIVVCGLARCGTSMMMKMLHRGGIEPICDPESLEYGYEYHVTMGLPHATAWLDSAYGKAVKILDPHRLVLPQGYPYSFILLTRDPAEQAKSHAKFLQALGLSVSRVERKAVERSLVDDLPVVKKLLASYQDSKTLTLRFEQVIDDPLGATRRLDDFLERGDFDLIAAAQAVLKRTTKCLPYLLEAQMVS